MSARVVNLAAAREQPAGSRGIVKRSDGHRLGDHGNRTPQPMRAAAVAELLRLTRENGAVTSVEKKDIAAAASVTVRQVNRWLNAALTAEYEQRTTATGTAVAHIDPAVHTDRAGQVLPGYLYRFIERNKLQLTPDEIAFFGRHTTVLHAIEAVRANPSHRLSGYAQSTLYEAWNNVAPQVRAGAKKNAKAQRAIEGTYRLSGRGMVNETWSIDEFDCKLKVRRNGVDVDFKVLVVLDRNTGLPLSYVVRTRAMNGTDTGVALAAAAIGYTVTHPYDADRTLTVCGVGKRLVSDQGGPFLGDDGIVAARRLGIDTQHVSTHTPQSNGDHEVMHKSLLRLFADGPGSRRAWADKAGNELNHGVIPFEYALDMLADWFRTYPHQVLTKGDHQGLTRLEAYAEQTAIGNVYRGHVLTPQDEGAVSVEVGTSTMDATRGLWFEGQYWFSPELGTAVKKGQKVTLKQLNDAGVLYAYDHRARFIGTVIPRDDEDLDDIETQHRNRYQRAQFVEHHIARPRADKASADAAAAWDETAERLAEVADNPTAGPGHAPDDVDGANDATARHLSPAPTDAAQVAVGDDPDAGTEPVREVLRPARRRRRLAGAPTPAQRVRSETEEDDAANALADLFSNIPHRQQDPQHDQTDNQN